ncbi:GatB/YqeY domain-containing protein [Patescibacteria group bacterium]|nr:GatB/YqeY domain-containing protein [Patescibacteria group bacterium]
MSIQDKIDSDLKEAMIKKDELIVTVLRMIKSALHNQLIAQKKSAAGEKSLSEDEVLKVIKSQAKQRRDSMAAFQKGDRNDLAAKEAKELEIIKVYLPEQLDPQEVKKVVQDIVASWGDGDKNFGSVMKQTMSQLQGKADGQIVSQMVKEELAT